MPGVPEGAWVKLRASWKASMLRAREACASSRNLRYVAVLRR